METSHVGKALESMFALAVKPDAIIGGNDRILVAILECSKEHVIEIPGDVALIGYDELTFT